MSSLLNGFRLISSLLPLLVLPALSSCRSSSKLVPVSESFESRVLWIYSDSKNSMVFPSKVFARGSEFLRVDMMLPFYGAAGSMALSRGRMTVHIPSKGKRYEGEFDIRALFPEVSPFPAEWLFALVRAKPLPGWPCEESRAGRERAVRCKAGDFQLGWVFENEHLRLIELADSKSRRLKGRVRGIAAKPLSEDFFVLPAL